MADVRVNGRRFPALQAVDSVGVLVNRLNALGIREQKELTSLVINGQKIDLDRPELMKMKLDAHDTIEALMETPEQLALQSLQVAQEMAELLVFDLKVATLSLWDNTRSQTKALETLLNDCNLFLNLGARPMDLLGCNPQDAEKEIESCLRQLDAVANNLEDAVLLATLGKTKESCQVLVGRVMPAIERWLQLSVGFAESLQLNASTDFEFDATKSRPGLDVVAGNEISADGANS